MERDDDGIGDPLADIATCAIVSVLLTALATGAVALVVFVAHFVWMRA